MPFVIQYAIYRDPLWLSPQSPYAVVAWLLDVDHTTGRSTGMSLPAEPYVELELARAAVLSHVRRTCVAPKEHDDPNLIEVWI